MHCQVCGSLLSYSRQLHLHVISSDLKFVKTKIHFQSFTTDFFVGFPVKDENESEKFKTFLTGQMKCHICNEHIKNIPNLKIHLTLHFP